MCCVLTCIVESVAELTILRPFPIIKQNRNPGIDINPHLDGVSSVFRSFILNQLTKMGKQKEMKVVAATPAVPSAPQSNASIESIRDRLARVRASFLHAVVRSDFHPRQHNTLHNSSAALHTLDISVSSNLVLPLYTHSLSTFSALYLCIASRVAV